jgi:hypothetical protein
VDEEKTCRRCGMRWESSTQRKTDTPFCASCRAKRHKIVRYGERVCIPHHGEYDEEDNPMESGILVLPGIRICGHKDCVNIDHVITDNP